MARMAGNGCDNSKWQEMAGNGWKWMGLLDMAKMAEND